MTDRFSAELMRGSLDMMVLSVLKQGPQYGYSIQQQLREATRGRVPLPAGTLYPLLHRLEAEQLHPQPLGRFDRTASQVVRDHQIRPHLPRPAGRAVAGLRRVHPRSARGRAGPATGDSLSPQIAELTAMSEQEFELYLKLLSRCLNLTPGQREQIADELRDHLEQRLEELAQAGVPREKAVVQALDEFGDAAVLAGNFATVARLKRRRFLMRLSLGSVGALTAALLIAFAFWPENRAVRGHERIVAQEKPIPAPPAAQKPGEPNASPSPRPVAKGGLGFGGSGIAGPPPVVEVCRPVTKEVTDHQFFSGNVQPSQRVQIRSRATGYLRKVDFRTGQVVKQGDMLFEIDPASYQIDLEKAKAEVERAEAKLKLALTKASRAKELNRRGEGPGGLAEETEQECQIAKADLQIARANRESAQLGLAWTRITAPIGGYISRSSFDVGSLVKAEESVSGDYGLPRPGIRFDLDGRIDVVCAAKTGSTS